MNSTLNIWGLGSPPDSFAPNPTSILIAEQRIALLESLRPPLSYIAASLLSPDPAESLAAVQSITRRYEEAFDDPNDLAQAIPRDHLFSLPYDSQVTLAAVFLAGLPFAIPPRPAHIVPDLAVRYRAAEIAAHIDSLPLNSISVLDLQALALISTERALHSGLWLHLAKHERPAVHDHALRFLREILELALAPAMDVAQVLLDLARSSSEAVAARCLDLLAEPCFEGMVCLALHPWLASEDAAPAAVRLAITRQDIGWVRRLATQNDVPRAAQSNALRALGSYGELGDVEFLVARLEEFPSRLGDVALAALQNAKRRGLSVDENQALAVVHVTLRHECLSLEMAAEITSSRADICLQHIDEFLSSNISKTRLVQLLGLWGTRNATARLMDMAKTTTDVVLSRAAMGELGRLEERAAEPLLLARLPDEPDVCLSALGKLGGQATIAHLRSLLQDKPPPWIHRALEVLFRLDPAPDILAHVLNHGAISIDVLDALPAYASAEQTNTLAAIAAAPGHPFRTSAMGALGRTGGLLAVDALGALLTDTDETVRTNAIQALQVLGKRLVLPDAPLLSCLAGSNDPGGALVAEAALRRLRQTNVSTMDAILLLDAVNGHAHPHLVRIVRPYLRRNNPEIRKRALACLAEAGAACSAWVLPYVHEDEPLPVVRQGLLALGKSAVPGMGQTIAKWLSHPNMNLKKTAAEMLEHVSDPGLIKTLVDVLAWQDQPGLRQLVEQALQKLAPKSARIVIIDKLLRTEDPRQHELLSAIIAPRFSAESFAALLAARPNLPETFVCIVIATHAKDAIAFATALRRRNLEHRFPKASDVVNNHSARPNLALCEQLRDFAVLRRHLREALFSDTISPELRPLVLATAERSHTLGQELSIPEQRLLAHLGTHADEPLRQAILVLLAASRDPFVQSRILPWMRLEGDVDTRCAGLLPAAVRRNNLGIGRRFVDHGDPRVREAAVRGQLIQNEFHLDQPFVQERRDVIRAVVETGREGWLSRMILGSDQTTFLEAVKRVQIHSGKTAAWEFAQSFVAENPRERERHLLALTHLGDMVLPWLIEFARTSRDSALRERALKELTQTFGEREPSLLQSILEDKHPGVILVAAQTLFERGDEQDRQHILERWLRGRLPGGFRVELCEQDAPLVLNAVENAPTESALEHLYAPIRALPVLARIRLWLRLRDSQHTRIAASARDALRNLPPADVWTVLQGAETQKRLGLLDVLGPSGWLPPFLEEWARQSSTSEEWIRFGLRAAGQGLLYAGTLGQTIAEWAVKDLSPPSLSLLGRLTDWYDKNRVEALLRILAPVLDGPHRERVVQMLGDVLREAPPNLLVSVFASWVRPVDTLAIQMLADAEASSPGLLALLAPELRAAVEKAMETALDTADPEAARKWLTYFASRAEHATERERVLVLLERHVGSSSRRVRLHAHRLLRTMASKERYLRASRHLLDDTDPTTIRMALRILSFGGDLESTGRFVEYLFHAHAGVSRSARDALLVLGTRAIPHLLRIRNSLRPDRRDEVNAIMDEIRRRHASN